MIDSDLNELLRRAEQMSADIEGDGDLPQVERNLRQILEGSNEIWSRVTQAGTQDSQVRAQILLSSGGIDLLQISQKLTSLSTRRTFESLDPAADTDVLSYLRNEKENAILSIIEQIHNDTLELSRLQQLEHILGEWKQLRSEIMNAMTSPSGELVDLRGLPRRTKLTGAMVSGLSGVEATYAKELRVFIDLVLRGVSRPNLFNIFAKAAKTLNDKKVSEMWEIAKYMADWDTGVNLLSKQLKRNDELIVTQARKYLENRYRLFMTSVVNENLSEAKQGGVPGTLNLVKNFVGIKLRNLRDVGDVLTDNKPLWPLVYYCLRTGDLNAALCCLNECVVDFPEFKVAIEEAAQNIYNCPSIRAESALKLHYRKHLRSSTDQYKKAAYNALVPCEPDDLHSEIICTADDYLWLKLRQIRESPDSDNAFTLDQLQTTILEVYGESYYRAQEQPFLYFSMLFLTGQFESAIEFLARGCGAQYLTHAVHLAAAMNECGALSVSQSISASLINADPLDKKLSKRLNFARLILLYVKRFESSDPKETLHYLFLLRYMKDSFGRNLFASTAAEMVVNSTALNRALLVGRMGKERRLPGFLDSFQSNTDDIINIAADVLYRRGLIEDAIAMYDLSGNHEQVLILMCTLMAQVVSQKQALGSLRSRLQKKSSDLTMRFQGVPLRVTSDSMSTFNTLRDLMIFFDQYHNNQPQSALKTITDSKLLPQYMKEVDEKIAALRRLSPEVVGSLADVLLATMTMLHNIYKNIKSMDSGDNVAREQQLKDLRDHARALTSFAGTMPHRMPNETNSRLVQMEILMH